MSAACFVGCLLFGLFGPSCIFGARALLHRHLYLYILYFELRTILYALMYSSHSFMPLLLRAMSLGSVNSTEATGRATRHWRTVHRTMSRRPSCASHHSQ